MSNFEDTTSSLNLLQAAIGTMLRHKAPKQDIFLGRPVSHLGCPNEQFDIHEKM